MSFERNEVKTFSKNILLNDILAPVKFHVDTLSTFELRSKQYLSTKITKDNNPKVVK